MVSCLVEVNMEAILTSSLIGNKAHACAKRHTTEGGKCTGIVGSGWNQGYVLFLLRPHRSCLYNLYRLTFIFLRVGCSSDHESTPKFPNALVHKILNIYRYFPDLNSSKSVFLLERSKVNDI